jgi:uncharacterized protein (DUF58 family)
MPFIPAARLTLLALVPLVFSAAAVFESALLWQAWVADALLLLLALADAWLGRHALVRVERQLPRTFSVGRANMVRLRVASLADWPLSVSLTEDCGRLVGEGLPVTLRFAPKGCAEVIYHVRPGRRGLYELGDHFLRWPTPLGLLVRQVRIPARDPVRVYPDLRAVRRYEVLCRRSLADCGLRTVRMQGGENEFEALRDYRRDDEYRAIDWKATARRQTLIVRQYQQERNQSVFCMLDCGRLMMAENHGLSQLDHALNAVLMLTHAATRAGDQVGLLAFDSRIRAFLPPQGGRRAAQQVVAASYDIHARVVETDFEAACCHLSSRVRKRSLVVLFTDVNDEVSAQSLVRTVRTLGARHLSLCVLFRDEAIDNMAEPRRAPGIAAGKANLYQMAAAAEVIGRRDRLVQSLREAGALVLHVAGRRLTPALIDRYLRIKAERLL